MPQNYRHDLHHRRHLRTVRNGHGPMLCDRGWAGVRGRGPHLYGNGVCCMRRRVSDVLRWRHV